MTPLRIQTTLKQERATYDLFKQLVQGKDVPTPHLLRKLKLNTNEDSGKAWVIIPKLVQEYGLYEHTVKQIYNSYLGSGPNGARVGILYLSITDESICGLIRRYASRDEMKTVWNWPDYWTACQCYKHQWCA
jgi:hypothetical protein